LTQNIQSKQQKTIVKLDIIVPRLFLNQYKNISSLSSIKNKQTCIFKFVIEF